MDRKAGAAATWVPNVSLYRQLLEQQPAALADSLPFSADASLGWLWQKEGIAHASLWHYATLEDQLQAAEEALQLGDTWLLDVGDLEYLGVSLAAATRDALLYSFRDLILAGRMLARFFREVAPPRLRMPPPASPVEHALGWEARRNNIPTEIVTLENAPVTRPKPADRIRRNLGILANNLAWKWGAGKQHQGQGTIMVFGGDSDFVNQLSLVEHLRTSRRYRVIHVSTVAPRASAYSRSTVTDQRSTFGLPPYTGLRQYLALRSLGLDAWQKFQVARPALEKRMPSLAALDPVFRHFFLHTLSRVGGALGGAEQLLATYQPDLIVVNNDSGGRERAIVLAARKRGIRSVQLIHSGFNDLHFRRFSTDELWVWGKVHQQQFAALGVAEARVRVTGNPNYDYLAELGTHAAEMRLDVRRKLDVAEDEILMLLITAKPPNLLTFVDMEQHVADLETLCTALGPGGKARLVIKPHPRYDDALVYHDLAARYPWVTVIDTWLLDQLLPACDGVVMVNTASTGGVEALLWDKPLIWIRPSTRYPTPYSIFDSAALTVERRSDIEPTMRRFLTVPEFGESVRRQGQAHLPDLVANRDARATQAVVDNIDCLMQNRRKEAES